MTKRERVPLLLWLTASWDENTRHLCSGSASPAERSCDEHVMSPQWTEGQRPEARATILKPHGAGRQCVKDFIAWIQKSSLAPLPKKVSGLETNHHLKLGRKENFWEMATCFEHFILANEIKWVNLLPHTMIMKPFSPHPHYVNIKNS